MLAVRFMNRKGELRRPLALSVLEEGGRGVVSHPLLSRGSYHSAGLT